MGKTEPHPEAQGIAEVKMPGKEAEQMEAQRQRKTWRSTTQRSGCQGKQDGAGVPVVVRQEVAGCYGRGAVEPGRNVTSNSGRETLGAGSEDDVCQELGLRTEENREGLTGEEHASRFLFLPPLPSAFFLFSLPVFFPLFLFLPYFSHVQQRTHESIILGRDQQS